MTPNRVTHDIQKFIEKYIEFSPKSRNAHLARFDLMTQRVNAGDLTETDLFSAAQQFFDVHKPKLYASSDLRVCLAETDKTLVSKVVEYALSCKDGSENVGSRIPCVFMLVLTI